MSYDDFEIGEIVWEGEFVAGKLLSKMVHPVRTSMGYLLVKDSKGRYTIFSCQTSAKSGICLVRYVPSEVMKTFAKEILEESVPPEKQRDIPSKEKEANKPENNELCDKPSPYFDFV